MNFCSQCMFNSNFCFQCSNQQQHLMHITDILSLKNVIAFCISLVIPYLHKYYVLLYFIAIVILLMPLVSALGKLSWVKTTLQHCISWRSFPYLKHFLPIRFSNRNSYINNSVYTAIYAIRVCAITEDIYMLHRYGWNTKAGFLWVLNFFMSFIVSILPHTHLSLLLGTSKICQLV